MPTRLLQAVRRPKPVPRIEKIGRERYRFYVRNVVYVFEMDPGPSQDWVLYRDSLRQLDALGPSFLCASDRDGVLRELLSFLSTGGYRVSAV